jgi:type VI secretion system VasD/TssJ family lipoprotein
MDTMILAILAVTCICGCSLNTRLAGSGARPSPGEMIHLKVQADPQLNRYEKASHALLLCLYQLKDPDGFRQLAQDKDGVPKLLECGRFDGSVVNARRIVVQPGENVSQSCDKGEGARYVGLATGYYGLGKKRVTELLAWPPRGAFGAPTGRLYVDLGAQEIRNAGVE